MALEDSVNTLVTQTTALLNTVNVAKATLDASVEDAGDFAQASLTSANNSATSASTATTQATAAQTARTGAETARDAAVVAQNNAVAVVTGGTATLTPEAGKIPLADGLAKIDAGWITSTALVEQSDIGTAPNKIPLNQYLGSAAYVDINTLNAGSLTNTTDISNVQPSLNLDFANVKKLDPRITFARASEARYYDGKTVSKAEENLFSYSQEFDNAYWTKTNNVTVTANATLAPDGTTTADLLVETVASGSHILGTISGSIPDTSKISTFMVSIFAKKGSGATAPDWVQIALGGSVSGYANFNLSTGASGNSSNCTSSIISNVDGWYRLVVQVNTPGASGLAAYVAFTNNTDATSRYPSYAGLTTSNVFIWGAQAEQRSAVSSYQPTTTQPITNYQPTLLTASANGARFDHDPITNESLGLLIEEKRTNLLLRSEEFDNAIWVKSLTTITANTITAPDGTLTGDKLVETSGAGLRQLYQTPSLSAGSHTFSIFAKVGERAWFKLNLTGGGAYFDLTVGAVGTVDAGVTASIQSVGNGWYHCSVAKTVLVGTNYPEIQVALTNGGASYTGDGYSGIYIWGAQLEAGAFPTSYIPTVASQVTRSADSASMTGANFSSWYRADEGTLYTDFIPYESGTNSESVLQFDDGTTSNRHIIYLQSGQRIGFITVVNGSTVNNLSSNYDSLTLNNTNKYAGSYSVNRFSGSSNGEAVVTNAFGVLPNNLVRAAFGSATASTNYLNGHIKKISYFPARLSNEELQEMTS